jgi:hypothetical protein
LTVEQQQEAGRKDDIRVDLGVGQRRRDAGERNETPHVRLTI